MAELRESMAVSSCSGERKQRRFDVGELLWVNLRFADVMSSSDVELAFELFSSSEDRVTTSASISSGQILALRGGNKAYDCSSRELDVIRDVRCCCCG